MGLLDNLFGSKPPVCTPAEAAQWAVTFFPESKRVTAAKVAKLLVEQTGLTLAAFTAESRFIENMQLVDLDSVEVVMALEEEFEISVPDSDAQRLTTIAELVDYVHSRIAPSGK